MSARGLSMALIVFAAACSKEASFSIASHLPCTFASEREDAWLHDHCDFEKATTFSRFESFDARAAALGGNFVEVVDIQNDMVRVKVFACAQRPGWYVTNRTQVVAETY